MQSEICSCCGMPVYDRYESGRYDAVCCSIECLNRHEEKIDFELEFGGDDESTEH